MDIVINDLNSYFKRKQAKELIIKRGDLVNGRIVDEVIYNTKLNEYEIFFNYSEFITLNKIWSYISSEDLETMQIPTKDKKIKTISRRI